jgi:hypothetical protein
MHCGLPANVLSLLGPGMRGPLRRGVDGTLAHCQVLDIKAQLSLTLRGLIGILRRLFCSYWPDLGALGMLSTCQVQGGI